MSTLGFEVIGKLFRVRCITKAAMGDIAQIDSIFLKKEGVLFEVVNKLNRKRKSLLAEDLFHNEELLMTLSKQHLCKISYQAALDVK